MAGYTKLFSSIIHSTIWRESSHVRIMWITMLAMADEEGVVEASIPGLMDAARVNRVEAEEALDLLSSPDPDSRNTDYEGRRIVNIEGGWLILNHNLYRNKKSKDEQIERRKELTRKRVQKYRESKKNNNTVKSNAEVTLGNASNAEVTLGNAKVPLRSDQTISEQTKLNYTNKEKMSSDDDKHVCDQIRNEYEGEQQNISQQLVALFVERFEFWPQDQVEPFVMKLRQIDRDIPFEAWKEIASEAWKEITPQDHPRMYQQAVNRKIKWWRAKTQRQAEQTKEVQQGHEEYWCPSSMRGGLRPYGVKDARGLLEYYRESKEWGNPEKWELWEKQINEREASDE